MVIPLLFGYCCMVVNVFSMWIGYTLTETKYRLADKFDWLNFQPSIVRSALHLDYNN